VNVSTIQYLKENRKLWWLIGLPVRVIRKPSERHGAYPIFQPSWNEAMMSGGRPRAIIKKSEHIKLMSM